MVIFNSLGSHFNPDPTLASGNIRAGIITYTILGIPYCSYSIMGPKTLFYLFRPLYYSADAASGPFDRHQKVRAELCPHPIVTGWYRSPRHLRKWAGGYLPLETRDSVWLEWRGVTRSWTRSVFVHLPVSESIDRQLQYSKNGIAGIKKRKFRKEYSIMLINQNNLPQAQ